MVSRRFLCLILSLAFLVFAGAVPASAQGDSNEIEEEEYAVYSTLITDISVRVRAEAVLIRDQTVAKAAPAQGLVADLVEDFSRKNVRPYRLENSLKTLGAYRLLSAEKEREIYSSPIPIVVLSRVGFNGAKDRALVYVSYRRDQMFGKEHFVLLEKGKRGWRVERKLTLFIPLRPV